MLKKFAIFGSALGFAGYASAQSLTQNAAAVKTEIDGLVGNAIGIYELVVPVIIAVVSLGVLLTFAKMVKKR